MSGIVTGVLPELFDTYKAGFEKKFSEAVFKSGINLCNLQRCLDDVGSVVITMQKEPESDERFVAKLKAVADVLALRPEKHDKYNSSFRVGASSGSSYAHIWSKAELNLLRCLFDFLDLTTYGMVLYGAGLHLKHLEMAKVKIKPGKQKELEAKFSEISLTQSDDKVWDEISKICLGAEASYQKFIDQRSVSPTTVATVFSNPAGVSAGAGAEAGANANNEAL